VERVPAAKYPAKKAELDTSRLVTFNAHLGGVSALAFIEEGARLVTAGAEDGTLRVWKVTYDMDEYEPDPVYEEKAVFIEEEEAAEEDEAGQANKLDVIYDRYVTFYLYSRNSCQMLDCFSFTDFIFNNHLLLLHLPVPDFYSGISLINGIAIQIFIGYRASSKHSVRSCCYMVVNNGHGA